MRRPAAVNDNMPSEEVLEVMIDRVQDRLDWVRPVFKTMRAIDIPDKIAQKTMTFLLKQLDQSCGDPAAIGAPTDVDH